MFFKLPKIWKNYKASVFDQMFRYEIHKLNKLNAAVANKFNVIFLSILIHVKLSQTLFSCSKIIYVIMVALKLKLTKLMKKVII